MTNKQNDDGSNGAPALYANIPIINIKNDILVEKKKEAEESKMQNVKVEIVEQTSETNGNNEVTTENNNNEENQTEYHEEVSNEQITEETNEPVSEEHTPETINS